MWDNRGAECQMLDFQRVTMNGGEYLMCGTAMLGVLPHKFCHFWETTHNAHPNFRATEDCRGNQCRGWLRTACTPLVRPKSSKIALFELCLICDWVEVGLEWTDNLQKFHLSFCGLKTWFYFVHASSTTSLFMVIGRMRWFSTPFRPFFWLHEPWKIFLAI